MKRTLRIMVGALGAVAALACSQGAFALQLSPQDCHAYPFVHTAHPTRADRMQELRLYERAGYNPGKEDPSYPEKVQHADHVIHEAYQKSCLNQ